MRTAEVRSDGGESGGARQRGLVVDELSCLDAMDGFPVVLEPGADGERGLKAVAQMEAERIRGHLFGTGAVLLRGFRSSGAGEFEEALTALGLTPADNYLFGIAKRKRHSGAAFTSTTWSKRAILPPHTEMAYMRRRPRWIAFYCAAPADRYGETPCFDMAAAFRLLPDRLAAMFDGARATYIRRIPGQRGRFGYERTIAETFGTQDRDEIASICRDLDVTPRWKGQGLLEAETTVDAVVRHPESGLPCLNAQFTEPAGFRYLFRRFAGRFSFKERCVHEALMFCAGLFPAAMHQRILINGRKLAARDIESIYDCMFQAATIFEWRKGDLLLLDNIRTGHGRLNVVGARKILTCFGDPYDVRG